MGPQRAIGSYSSPVEGLKTNCCLQAAATSMVAGAPSGRRGSDMGSWLDCAAGRGEH